MTTSAPPRPTPLKTDSIKIRSIPGEREALEQFRRKEGLRSISEACRELIRRGFAASN